MCFYHGFRKNGRTVHVIDPNYKEVVEAKVVEVFGVNSLKSVYKMIEDVLEDEKMVSIYMLIIHVNFDLNFYLDFDLHLSILNYSIYVYTILS